MRIEGMFAYLSQPMTDTVYKTQMIFLTLLIIFIMNENNIEISLSPPPLNCHRFFKRCKTQCLHLITDFFNVHMFECNNFTFGTALRGHHLNRLKSFESQFSLYLSLYIQLLAKSCQFYFQKSLTSISHPIVTVEHFFFFPNIFFFFFPFDY